MSGEGWRACANVVFSFAFARRSQIIFPVTILNMFENFSAPRKTVKTVCECLCNLEQNGNVLHVQTQAFAAQRGTGLIWYVVFTTLCLPCQWDPAVQEFGTLCLSCLSTDSCCQVQILDNKGLPLLVNFLSNADPDVQKNSLDIIYNLIQVI